MRQRPGANDTEVILLQQFSAFARLDAGQPKGNLFEHV